jgi:hypothetical protein
MGLWRVHAALSGAVLLLALGVPLQGQTTMSTSSTSDVLLDRLVGAWRMVGQIRGRPVEYRLSATRVLNQRFVELHMIDIAQPPQYQARVFVGADTTPGRVLVHWLDSFGAAYSVPAAAGAVRGDTLLFEFQYSDGPFRDTFVFRGPGMGWHFRLESSDGQGGWRLFGEYDVTPVLSPPR